LLGVEFILEYLNNITFLEYICKNILPYDYRILSGFSLTETENSYRIVVTV